MLVLLLFIVVTIVAFPTAEAGTARKSTGTASAGTLSTIVAIIPVSSITEIATILLLGFNSCSAIITASPCYLLLLLCCCYYCCCCCCIPVVTVVVAATVSLVFGPCCYP